MKRILVVLPNWFGETLFATPFIEALRRHHSDAQIATLGWSQCRAIVAHNPAIVDHIDYEDGERSKGLVAYLRVAGQLRRAHWDAAFILRRSLSRTLLATLAGIGTRIGFASAKSGWLLTHRARPPLQVRPEKLKQLWLKHYVDQASSGFEATSVLHKAASYFELLEELGFSEPLGACRYVLTPEERQQAQELLAEAGLENGSPFVVLHPGANWFHKRWAPEKFAELGRRLIADYRVRIVITGGPDDVDLAQTVFEQLEGNGILIAGRTTLRQLAACLATARAVIAGDTGVLHVAAALGLPVVGLYGPTSPLLTGPLGIRERTFVIHHADACPQIPCYEPSLGSGHFGMDAIKVDEVYAAASKLLNGNDG